MKKNQYKTNKASRLWDQRKGEIEHMYFEMGMSMDTISKYYKMSQTGISKVMKKLNIESIGRGRSGSRNSMYIDGTQSRIYRKMIEKIQCSKCMSNDKLLIHHKNGVHTDNRLCNLDVLCRPCHTSYHKKLWWKKKKLEALNV